MRFVLAIVIIAFVFFTSACKSTKEVNSLPLVSADSKDLLHSIESSSSDFDNVFYKKCSFSLKADKTDTNLSGSLFIQKDSFIILSLQALLGIEVARIKFSPQNIVIIDRLNKSVTTQDYKQIGIKYGVELNYNSIELLLLNKPFELDSTPEVIDFKDYNSSVLSNNYVLKLKDSWSFFFNSKQSNYTQEFTISAPPNKLLTNSISFPASNRSIKFSYDNFDFIDGFIVPKWISCHGKNGDIQIVVDIKISTIVFNSVSALNFSIPSSYDVLSK